MKQPAIYMLASARYGTIYTGVTSNLVGRIWQHREHLADGFSKRYEITKLTWYELAQTVDSAIFRKKQIRKWNRAWKIRLIEATDPDWVDLWPGIAGLAVQGGFPPARE